MLLYAMATMAAVVATVCVTDTVSLQHLQSTHSLQTLNSTV